MVRLAEVEVERLRELVTDAWRMRAPKTILDEGGAVVDASKESWAERQ